MSRVGELPYHRYRKQKRQQGRKTPTKREIESKAKKPKKDGGNTTEGGPVFDRETVRRKPRWLS